MSTVKISDLPEITHLNVNTANTLAMGVDLETGVTGKMTITTLAEGLYSHNPLNVGNNEDTYPNTIAQFAGTSNNYIQVSLENINNDYGTADYVVGANTGTDTTLYADFGFANKNFNNLNSYNGLGTSLHALDGYLYVQGNTAGYPGGNLVIGTTSVGTNVNFIAGGANAVNIVAKVTNTGLTLNGSSYLTFSDSSVQYSAASPANYSQAAYAQANVTIGVDASQNSRMTIIEGVDVSQNARMTIIEGTDVTQNNSISTINGINLSQNNQITIIQGVDVGQNTAISATNGKMESAYNKANNALANTTGTFAGDLTITGNTSVGGYISIAKSDTDANTPLVKISASADGSSFAASNNYYVLQLTGKPNNATRLVMDDFGSNTYPVLVGRSARGTVTSPTASANNDVLMRIVGNGYTGTQFPASSPTKIDFVATENFSNTNRGTAIQFWNTPNGSNTIQKIAQFNATEVSFTGTINPTKGFIYAPVIYPGAQTAITLDISDGPLVRAQTTTGLTVTLSNFVAGKVIELWVTNLAGTNQTFTHGVSAINSTVNSTTYAIPSTSSIVARYVCLDGTLANTMCSIIHS